MQYRLPSYPLYIYSLGRVFRLSPLPLLRLGVRPSFFPAASGSSSWSRAHGGKKGQPFLFPSLPSTFPRLTQLVAQYSIPAGRWVYCLVVCLCIGCPLPVFLYCLFRFSAPIPFFIVHPLPSSLSISVSSRCASFLLLPLRGFGTDPL